MEQTIFEYNPVGSARRIRKISRIKPNNTPEELPRWKWRQLDRVLLDANSLEKNRPPENVVGRIVVYERCFKILQAVPWPNSHAPWSLPTHLNPKNTGALTTPVQGSLLFWRVSMASILTQKCWVFSNFIGDCVIYVFPLFVFVSPSLWSTNCECSHDRKNCITQYHFWPCFFGGRKVFFAFWQRNTKNKSRKKTTENRHPRRVIAILGKQLARGPSSCEKVGLCVCRRRRPRRSRGRLSNSVLIAAGGDGGGVVVGGWEMYEKYWFYKYPQKSKVNLHWKKDLF